MWRNPRGYLHSSSEKEESKWLEEAYLKQFHEVRREVNFAPSCIIDFLGFDNNNKYVFIEVKNWFITIKDIQQLIKYVIHAIEEYGEDKCRFIIIAGGIEELRRRLLEKIGVEIVLTRDLK